jgi:large subunit ribosomal protein L25
MEQLNLKAARREVLGKKNRFLRRQGITPAHLFGHGVASQALQCDTAELRSIIAHAGETRLITLKVEGDDEARSVFVREVQTDALGRYLLHVDFYQVKKGEKMAVNVPIVIVGESPAMKGKNRMLSHGITELPVECLPDKVPPQIEIDISILEELEQPIQVKDIVLDPEITVHADPEQLIVKVTEVMVKPEEEEVVEEEVEEEVEEGAEGETRAEEGGEKPAAEKETGEKEKE